MVHVYVIETMMVKGMEPRCYGSFSPEGMDKLGVLLSEAIYATTQFPLMAGSCTLQTVLGLIGIPYRSR